VLLCETICHTHNFGIYLTEIDFIDFIHPIYSYLKQTKLSFFFFYRNREQESRTGPFWRVATRGKGEDVGCGEGMCGSVNMVQILYTHACKWKIETF
jgi:hypothetical protein